MQREPDMPPKIIDMKLPLAWLITSTVAVVLTMFAVAVNFNRQVDQLSFKMDAVLISNAELKSQSEKRDLKYENTQAAVYATQRALDSHELRLNALERASNRGR